MGKQRPWKKYVIIRKCELNNGDIYYSVSAKETDEARGIYEQFQSLAEAEAHADAWWAAWWPKQMKSVRNA